MSDPGPVGSVYVHAPWCARRCPYCDFAVRVDPHPDPGPWLDALRTELALVDAEGAFPLGPLETLFVGGGTPSLLGPHAMTGLRGLLEAHWPRGGPREWTAEANPESFTQDVARAWRAAGVTRVSLGVQSLDAGVLRWMGRLHGPEGARAAVAVARDAGFDHVSVDLIFAVPERLGRDWAADLDGILALDVDHVSLYGLTAEPGTPLGRWVEGGREALPDESAYARDYLKAHRVLTAAGFAHYEVSSYARPGGESLHNRRYWDGSPYLGLGLGAHSYRHPLRRWNVRDLDMYLGALCRGVLPSDANETLDPAASRLERIWLGLRTDVGVELVALSDEDRDRVAAWEARQWATTADGRLRLTPQGWLRLDELAVGLRGLDPSPRSG